jgi:hypothetical protein
MCVFVSVIASDVAATVFAPKDFSDLVRNSRAIAHGHVVTSRTRETFDRVRVETLVTLRVAAYLKGDFGEEVTFVVPGGTFGRYRSLIPGAPQFREGEEVVLFLNARGPSIPYVMRLGQGVFRVVRQPGSDQRRIVPSPVVASDDWTPVIRGDASRAPVPFDDFTAQVRQLLEERR